MDLTKHSVIEIKSIEPCDDEYFEAIQYAVDRVAIDLTQRCIHDGVDMNQKLTPNIITTLEGRYFQVFFDCMVWEGKGYFWGKRALEMSEDTFLDNYSKFTNGNSML